LLNVNTAVYMRR